MLWPALVTVVREPAEAAAPLHGHRRAARPVIRLGGCRLATGRLAIPGLHKLGRIAEGCGFVSGRRFRDSLVVNAIPAAMWVIHTREKAKANVACLNIPGARHTTSSTLQLHSITGLR